ncbi:MAG TPA: hypothetical protein VK922_03135 [Gemmatimonadaceae bacterium]|nr:hypothetical protein [Gemmatimonadaceae bacterium]
MDGPVIFVPITLFIAIAVVLAPLARALGKRIENRGAPPPLPSDVAQRLERMEQAIDAIAIEVERISEGQRFTTRLLSDATSAGALPGGARRP